MIIKLREKYGKKCSLVSINGIAPKTNIPSHKMRFCEAVSCSFKIPIQLSAKNLGCQGARRNFGYYRNEEQLIKNLADSNGVPELFASEALTEIPFFKKAVKEINLGITEELESYIKPELLILYLDPFQINKLIADLARIEVKPYFFPYTFLSVCGGILTNAYFNQHVSLSVGCAESRRYGGVKNDEIVVGMPIKIVKQLLS